MAETDAAAQLLEIWRIQQLKARYCRYVDTKQWERLAGLFTEETRFEGFGSAPTGADAKAFIAGISKRLARVVSIHHCHMPEIVLTGQDTARGVWSMMDYLEFPADEVPKEAPDSRGFIGYGHYEERYRKSGGEWRFVYMRLSRQRVDPLPKNHPGVRPDLLKVTPDWLERG